MFIDHCPQYVKDTSINIDCHRAVAAAVVVLLAEMAVGIEEEAEVADRLGKRAAVADVAKLAVVLAAVVETVRIVAVHRWKMVAEVVEIVPAAALPRPNVEVAVPSFLKRLVALETSARASVATAAACQAVEEDARPLT